MTQDHQHHLGLLCDVGELATLLASSENIDAFLNQIVHLTARHFHADVASIYLCDDNEDLLTLAATHGLNPSQVGQVQLKEGEGLVGRCLQQMAPVREDRASRSPHFKYFSKLNEDPYDSFMAVPIRRGGEKIGVLVVQREEQNAFSEEDLLALRVAASQLSGAIGTARLLLALHAGDGTVDCGGMNELGTIPAKPLPQLIRGEMASDGYAFGPAIVLDRKRGGLALPDNVAELEAYTQESFDTALAETARQLKELGDALSDRLSEGASLIFSAHLLMLKDPEFTDDIRRRISQGENPVHAVMAVAGHYAKLFATSKNPYIREKSDDINDLARRIIVNIIGDRADATLKVADHVLLAWNLYPSDILRFSTENVAGIALASGGVTSHIAILARSLRIPMVIVDEPALLQLRPGTPVLLEAGAGRVHIDPAPEVVAKLKEHHRSRLVIENAQIDMPSRTRDGVRVHLQANINLLADLKLAQTLNLEGVGLYRTEFPFLIRSAFPTEEEQFGIYRKLLDAMPGREVTIRTLDIGGDKMLAYYEHAEEKNPALGLRSTRFVLSQKDVLRTQLRAILRAGAGHEKMRIMFPMISSIDEFLAVREEVEFCRNQLRQKGVDHNESPEIGAMVEIPSLVEMMDEFAEVADFFCIGTNDFIQFMLAADRGNEKVSSYYLPHHPAVLRGLHRIIQSAMRQGKDISICGEMAHQERYIPFLLGCGIRTFSLDPRYAPAVHQLIGSLSISDTETHCKKLLQAGTIARTDSLLPASKDI